MILGLAAAGSLAFTVVAPASAQAIPGGSYQQSCSNIRARGDRLTASCTASNGQLVRSSISLGCRGDIANSNGQLTCNGGGYGYNRNNGYSNNNGYGNRRDSGYGTHRDNGYGNGGYNNGNGYGNNGYGNRNGYAPGGSYQGSCSNVQMNGNMLSATCSASNGARITSTLDANRCHGGDIANVNGRLRCR